MGRLYRWEGGFTPRERLFRVSPLDLLLETREKMSAPWQHQVLRH